jgi:hypothetical protein
LINFYSDKIQGDKYSNMLANSLVEIPAYLLGGAMIFYLGIRVSLYVGSLVAISGGLCLWIFGNPTAPALPNVAYIFITLASKGGILVLINAVYFSTATIFPPIFSGAVFGICNTFAKSVAATGPVVAELSHPIPAALFVCMTAINLPSIYYLQIRKKNDSYRDK